MEATAGLKHGQLGTSSTKQRMVVTCYQTRTEKIDAANKEANEKIRKANIHKGALMAGQARLEKQ